MYLRPWTVGVRDDCGVMHEPMLSPAEPINGEISIEMTSDGRPASRSGQATMCRLFGLLHAKELCMIFIATCATLVASLLQMALPVLSGWLITAISTDKGYPDECKNHMADCRRARLQKVVALMGACFVVAGATLAVGLWLYMLSGERLVARLRRKLFASYVQQDLAFYDSQKTGELMKRLSSD